MNFTKRLLMVSGAVALASILTIILTPKATHAVVSTLVQMTNTVANPGVTEDVSKASSSIVELTCVLQPPPGFFSDFCGKVDPNSGSTIGIFTVPANQRLVITSIDVIPFSTLAAGTLVVVLEQDDPVALTSVAREIFTLPGGTMTQFQYPVSGIVIGPGMQLSQHGSSVADFRIRGYLTSN
jgi:hypothetical protein